MTATAAAAAAAGNPVAALVHWTLAIRCEPTQARTRSTLTRAVTPAFAQRALADPVIARRLTPLTHDRKLSALSALAVIAGNRHLHHDGRIPLGKGLAALRGASPENLLAAATAMSQPNAARLLGSAVALAGEQGPMNLIEFTELLTDWDHLESRARAQFLIDFYAYSA